MKLNFESIVEQGKKDIVVMFKNQREGILDIKLLKHSIKQWSRLYKDFSGDIYVCGGYSDKEVKDIQDYLTANFIKKYNVTIMNIGAYPTEFNNHKVNRANYQFLVASKVLPNGFILAYNDTFPIKPIDDTYLNKEYDILVKDYTKMPNDLKFWWTEQYINTSKYFEEKYGVSNKTIYVEHHPQYYNAEFIEFYHNDKNLWFDMSRDVVLTHYNLMQGYNILRDKYMITTFRANKWVANKKEVQKAKMLDVTVPEHPKTQALMKKLLLK